MHSTYHSTLLPLIFPDDLIRKSHWTAASAAHGPSRLCAPNFKAKVAAQSNFLTRLARINRAERMRHAQRWKLFHYSGPWFGVHCQIITTERASLSGLLPIQLQQHNIYESLNYFKRFLNIPHNAHWLRGCDQIPCYFVMRVANHMQCPTTVLAFQYLRSFAPSAM